MGGGGCNENISGGGVAMRILWYALFAKKLVEGVYSVLESTLAYDKI